jgi:preprotein translocase subunit SecA
MIRNDSADQVYKNQRAKYAAVVKDIEEMHKLGRPVLVGTTSIDKNEIISQFLTHKGIPHQVLNAKQHEKEALIISGAGKKGAVTVATNMAGRGVDIILGGNQPTHEDGRPKLNTPEMKKWQKDHDEVVALGGLHVIGTERHESRRIDNQLRGRAGRQGDPGSSRFFIALDDEIMRLFGGDQVSKLMTFFNLPEDQPLEHGIVNKSIEQAQSKVEQFNFDHRKHLLEYDDVMNKQREIIYDLRRRVLSVKIDIDSTDKKEKLSPQEAWLKEEILKKLNKEITNLVLAFASGLEENHDEKIIEEFSTIIPFDPNSKKDLVMELSKKSLPEEKVSLLQKIADGVYRERESQLGVKITRFIEQQESLRIIDMLWMEHLETINDLREGINLRGYAQRDPLVEYKSEAFNLFEKLVSTIDFEIIHRIFKISVAMPDTNDQIKNLVTNAEQIESLETGVKQEGALLQKELAIGGGLPPQAAVNMSQVKTPKKNLGRNDPCWCGSGKKYKRCHYPN